MVNDKNLFKAVSVCALLTFFIPAGLCQMPAAYGSSMPMLSEDISSASGNRRPMEIPSELGQVTGFFQTSADKPILIHIQNAHGHYETQKTIQSILAYLYQNYGMKKLLLEGASHKLRPGLFRFFPEDEELSTRIIESLLKVGELTGAEAFLTQYQNSEGWGVENLKAYGENREDFRKVVTASDRTAVFLEDSMRTLEKISLNFMNKDLIRFIREERSCDLKQISLGHWLNFLGQAAKKQTQIDLGHPRSQRDWPMLVRYFRLQALEGKGDGERRDAEKQRFFEVLRSYDVHPDLVRRIRFLLDDSQAFGEKPFGGGSASPEVRFIFERLLDVLPDDFSFEGFPVLKKGIQRRILQSELSGERFLRETHDLSARIADTLAGSGREKQALELFRDHRFLDRLFKVKLTRKDWEMFKESEIERVAPSNLRERLSALSEGHVLDKVNEIDRLDAAFHAAVSFYRGAEDRESWMAENILPHLAGESKTGAVLITGGFHSEGLKEKIIGQGLSYVQIMPRISTLEGDHFQTYLKALLGDEMPQRSHIEALLRQDPVALREIDPSLAVFSERRIRQAALDQIREIRPGQFNVLSEKLAHSQLFRMESRESYAYPDRKELIPAVKYPRWVRESLQRAEKVARQIPREVRILERTFRLNKFPYENQLTALDRHETELGFFLHGGASGELFDRFVQHHDEFWGLCRELGRQYNAHYISQCELLGVSPKLGVLQKAGRRLAPQAERKYEQMRKWHNEAATSTTRMHSLVNQIAAHINALLMFLRLRPDLPDSRFISNLRTELKNKASLLMRRETMKGNKRAKLGSVVSLFIEKGLNKALQAGSAPKAKERRRKRSSKGPVPGTLVMNDAGREGFIHDVRRLLYAEVSQEVFSWEEDRARLEEFADLKTGLQTRDVAEEEAQELLEIISRAHLSHREEAIEIRQRGAFLLNTILPRVLGLPRMHEDLSFYVPSWMRHEREIRRWDDLVRLFGDFADEASHLSILLDAYDETQSLSAKIQLITAYFRVMDHIRQKDPSAGLHDALGWIDELIAVVSRIPEPDSKMQEALESFMRLAREYVMNHWREIQEERLINVPARRGVMKRNIRMLDALQFNRPQRLPFVREGQTLWAGRDHLSPTAELTSPEVDIRGIFAMYVPAHLKRDLSPVAADAASLERQPGDKTGPEVSRSEMRDENEEEKRLPGGTPEDFRRLIADIISPAERPGGKWVTALHQLTAFIQGRVEAGGDPNENDKIELAIQQLSKFEVGSDRTAHINVPLAGSAAARLLAGLDADDEDERQGRPKRKNPQFPVSELALAQYIEAFQGWLLDINHEKHFVFEPGIGKEYCRDQRAPFDAKPILAALKAGMEPSSRSFPEFARALTIKDVQAVTLIEPAENSVPALLIHFGKPFRERFSGQNLRAVSVAVLKGAVGEPLSMRPEEMLSLVESSREDVARRTFQEGDPEEEKVSKLQELFNLALSGRLLVRVGYSFYSYEGIARMAELLGRTTEEKYAIRRDLEIMLERDAGDPDNPRYYVPATEDLRQELERRFQNWLEARRKYGYFGKTHLAALPASLQRIGVFFKQAGKKGEKREVLKEELLNLRASEVYRPLIELLFARKEDDWVIDFPDLAKLAKQLEQTAAILVNTQPKLEEMAASFPNPADRAVFIAEVLQGILTGLPYKPRQVFRKEKNTILLAREVLADLSREALAPHLDPERMPTFVKIAQRTAKEALPDPARIQGQIWDLLVTGGEAKVADEMQKLLKQLTEIGQAETEIKIPSLPLKNRVQFETAVTALRDWLAAFLAGMQDKGDPYKLKVYGTIIDFRRLAEEGDAGSAVELGVQLLPRLQSREKSVLMGVLTPLAGEYAMALDIRVESGMEPEKVDAVRSEIGKAKVLLADFPDASGLLEEAEKKLGQQFPAVRRQDERMEKAEKILREHENELKNPRNHSLMEFLRLIAGGEGLKPGSKEWRKAEKLSRFLEGRRTFPLYAQTYELLQKELGKRSEMRNIWTETFRPDGFRASLPLPEEGESLEVLGLDLSEVNLRELIRDVVGPNTRWDLIRSARAFYIYKRKTFMGTLEEMVPAPPGMQITLVHRPILEEIIDPIGLVVTDPKRAIGIPLFQNDNPEETVSEADWQLVGSWMRDFAKAEKLTFTAGSARKIPLTHPLRYEGIYQDEEGSVMFRYYPCLRIEVSEPGFAPAKTVTAEVSFNAQGHLEGPNEPLQVRIGNRTWLGSFAAREEDPIWEVGGRGSVFVKRAPSRMKLGINRFMRMITSYFRRVEPASRDSWLFWQLVLTYSERGILLQQRGRTDSFSFHYDRRTRFVTMEENGREYRSKLLAEQMMAAAEMVYLLAKHGHAPQFMSSIESMTDDVMQDNLDAWLRSEARETPAIEAEQKTMRRKRFSSERLPEIGLDKSDPFEDHPEAQDWARRNLIRGGGFRFLGVSQKLTGGILPLGSEGLDGLLTYLNLGPASFAAAQSAGVFPASQDYEGARSVLGIRADTQNAFILLPGFALEEGGAALIRAVFGDSPAVILVRDVQDTQFIQQHNEDFIRSGRRPIQIAHDFAEAQRKLRGEFQEAEDRGGSDIRYYGLASVWEPLAETLRQQIPDGVITRVTRGMFERIFDRYPHLGDMVARFRAQFEVMKSA